MTDDNIELVEEFVSDVEKILQVDPKRAEEFGDALLFALKRCLTDPAKLARPLSNNDLILGALVILRKEQLLMAQELADNITSFGNTIQLLSDQLAGKEGPAMVDEETTQVPGRYS